MNQTMDFRLSDKICRRKMMYNIRRFPMAIIFRETNTVVEQQSKWAYKKINLWENRAPIGHRTHL